MASYYPTSLAIGLLLPGLLVPLAARQSRVEKPPLASPSTKLEFHFDARTASGKLIAEGLNKTPVGPYGLLTYKLEKVELPASGNQNIAESTVRRKTTLRLTITGKSLETVNKVWLGDSLLPTVWSHGPSKIGTFINDPSILRDDSDISIVDGRGEIHSLPERLKLPQSFKAFQKPEKTEEGNQIVSVRSGLKVHGSRQQRIVMIEMRTARAFPIINSVYYAQIGRKFFELGGQGRRWVVELTDKEFAELKDGDRVAIGIGIGNLAYLGRLNKSMLDR